jgi:hypothetical protein
MEKAHERSQKRGLTEKRAQYYEDGFFDGYIEGQLAATDRLLEALNTIYGKKVSIPDALVRPIGKAETR